ncbi:MAG TPA: hypothetical protein VFW44_11335 [Bryobacteraceae bacterium]|nr:hypothetical protein [Bryobacteraceae bacterium]
MKLALQMGLLMVATTVFAVAGTPSSAPEIGAGTAVSALSLLGCALLIIRAKRK